MRLRGKGGKHGHEPFQIGAVSGELGIRHPLLNDLPFLTGGRF